MAGVMEVTESHTLVEYNDWLQVMTVMLCVLLVQQDSVNLSGPGTVIFLERSGLCFEVGSFVVDRSSKCT